MRRKKVLTLNNKEASHRLPPWDREFLFPNTYTDNNVRYIGSSHGWISCCTYPSSNIIFLFDPLSPSDSIIFLPPLPNIVCDLELNRENYLEEPHPCSIAARKLILSSPPSDPDCRAVVVDGSGFIWICKPGDRSWTRLAESDVEYPRISPVSDIAYSNWDECLYVLNGIDLAAWDLSDPKSPKRSKILTTPKEYPAYTDNYLVPTSSDLLLVVRYLQDVSYFEDEINATYPNEKGLKPEHFINEFDVFSLDANSRRWESGSLAQNAVFIGKNHSFSIDVGAAEGHNLPVEASSIYFTENCYIVYEDYGLFDANSHGGFDMGVYNEKKSEVICHYFRDKKKKSIKQPPIWLLPNCTLETLVETEVDTYWGRIPFDSSDYGC